MEGAESSLITDYTLKVSYTLPSIIIVKHWLHQNTVNFENFNKLYMQEVICIHIDTVFFFFFFLLNINIDTVNYILEFLGIIAESAFINFVIVPN